MNLDYESLRCIAWVFLWLLIINFSITGGHDLGTAILLPFLAKTDKERSQLINLSGFTWNSHQIWFIFIGIVLFSAWPIVYAVLFSSMSYVLFFSIMAVLLRPFAVNYRHKLSSEKSRCYWDKGLFLSGFIPLFIFGLTLGNLLKGIAFHLDSDMRIIYYGDFWGWLNPFALLIAITTLGLFTLYGAVYVQLKTETDIAIRAQEKVQLGAIIVLIGFILTGLWVMRLEGYHINSEILQNGFSNPLTKFVKRGEGLWLDNYEHIPALAAIPIVALISCGLTIWLSAQNRPKLAIISSKITIVGMISTVALSMFPFILPSTMSLNSSLTLWDSSSSYNTLQIMLWGTIIFLPLMCVYVRWIFKLCKT